MEQQSSAVLPNPPELRAVRNALFGLGLMIALFIAGAAWTMQPKTAARVAPVPTETSNRKTMIGRVISVGSSGHIVTIEAADESTDAHAITVGDPVEVVRANANGTGSSKGTRSRRLLGVCCLAVFGTIVAFRARRPLTI